MSILKVGLIGYGFSGKTFHAPVLEAVDEMNLTHVLSSKEDIVKKDYPNVNVVNSIEDLLKSDVDLVINAAPNSLHYEYSKLSLEAGKHVVVEKPFTNNLKEAQELNSLAEQKKLLLSVYHNRRYDSDFLTLKKCIEEGLIGDVLLFKSTFNRFSPEVKDRWREADQPGSGVLFDLGSHLIDQALVLFGEPTKYYGAIKKQRDGAKTDDFFHVTLEFGNKVAVVEASCLVKSPGPKFEVHGSRGSFVKYGMDTQEESLKAGYKPTAEGWGAEPQEQWALVSYQDQVAQYKSVPGDYAQYYRDVAHGIKNHTNPVKPVEAAKVIEIIENLKSSL